MDQKSMPEAPLVPLDLWRELYAVAVEFQTLAPWSVYRCTKVRRLEPPTRNNSGAPSPVRSRTNNRADSGVELSDEPSK